MKTISKLFSVCFRQFLTFSTHFSFCVVGPYLSFTSSKFKLILKRFGQKICFSSKERCYFRLKIIPKQFFFFAVFIVFDRILVFVQFGRFGCLVMTMLTFS